MIVGIRHFLLLISLALVGSGEFFGQDMLTVDEVEILGNRKTKIEVFMHELPFYKGAVVSSSAIDSLVFLAEKNLTDLSLFNYVEVIPQIKASTISFRINVVERWYIWPSFMLELADPNFNVWWETKDFSRLNYALIVHKNNLRGQNESLYLKMKTGYTNEIKLSYTDPHLFDYRRLGFVAGVSGKENEEVTIATKENRREFFRINGIKSRRVLDAWSHIYYRPTRNHKLGFSTRFRSVNVGDSLGLASPEYLGTGIQNLNLLGFGVFFESDQRDLRYYPLRGHYAYASAEWVNYGAQLNETHSFLRSVLGLAQYKKWGDRWYGSAGLDLKWDLGPVYPYHLIEGLGFNHFVRGYEYYVFDVRHYAVAKSSIKYALMPERSFLLDGPSYFNTPHLAIYAGVFMDVGYGFSDYFGAINSLSDQLLLSGGLGVDFVTFYDKVIRLETTLNKEQELGFFLHFTKPI